MATAALPVRVSLVGDEIRLSPTQLRIYPAENRQIEWITDEGTLEIHFSRDQQTPFERADFGTPEGGGKIRPGELRPGLEAGSTFPYELILKRGAEILKARGIIEIASRPTGPDERGDTDDVAAGPAKPVTIRLDGAGSVVVAPDPVKVNRKKREQVEWTCEDGSFEIEFNKDGTPFDQSMYGGSQSQGKKSGPCRSNAQKDKTYHYTVTVQPATGGPPIVLDPGVTVEDDGGDGR